MQVGEPYNIFNKIHVCQKLSIQMKISFETNKNIIWKCALEKCSESICWNIVGILSYLGHLHHESKYKFCESREILGHVFLAVKAVFRITELCVEKSCKMAKFCPAGMF